MFCVPLFDESGTDKTARPLVITARCAEIGAAVVYLASPAGRKINGVILLFEMSVL